MDDLDKLEYRAIQKLAMQAGIKASRRTKESMLVELKAHLQERLRQERLAQERSLSLSQPELQ